MKAAKMFARVLIIGLVFVLGCSSPESRLTGKWIPAGMKDNEVNIEFFSDKTVHWKSLDAPLDGKWIILSDGRIKADFDTPIGKITCLGELEGKSLILEMDGKKVNLVKM